MDLLGCCRTRLWFWGLGLRALGLSALGFRGGSGLRGFGSGWGQKSGASEKLMPPSQRLQRDRGPSMLSRKYGSYP